MKPILRSYLAEVNLGTTTPGNGQNINVQDYPQLRDVYICGVEVFDSGQLAISPSGKTVVTTLTGLTLTLMDKFNMEILYQYPTFDLNPTNVGGFYRDFKPFYLQLTKSYVTVLDATTVAANQSVMLNIFYVLAKDWEKYKSIYGDRK
jgi:hypothetical protein